MSALLARALCGVLVLAGMVGAHVSSARTEAVPPLSPQRGAAPDVTVATSPVTQPQIEYRNSSIYRVHRVTAYCDRGLTASGVPAGIGQCAAPADIPFGTRIHIPALDRTFIVTDRTAKRFRRNTVDLFIPDRTECKRFGRQYLECEITLPVEPPRYGSRRLRAALTAASL